MSSPAPTLGIELELHLVDPRTRDLVEVAPQVLADLQASLPGAAGGDEHPKAKRELFRSTVEIVTAVCTTAGEARADLAATLAEVREVAAHHGAVPMSAGTHPFAQPRDATISDDDRYHALVEEMQWTARRLLICGTHFHVGVPSGEHSIAVLNEALRHLPLLQVLAASSPFFAGDDTGLACVRPKIFELLPTAGLPPHIGDWAGFESYMATLGGAGVVRSIKDVWWDIRPHPEYGTVELRMCDAGTTLREVTAIAALAQCIVADAIERFDSGELPAPPLPWTVKENRWLAARHGVNTDLIATDDGQRVPAEVLLDELLDRLAPVASRLRCATELADVGAVWREGPSYLRQRRLVEAGGSLHDVVDQLVAETAEGDRGAASAGLVGDVAASPR